MKKWRVRVGEVESPCQRTGPKEFLKLGEKRLRRRVSSNAKLITRDEICFQRSDPSKAGRSNLASLAAPFATGFAIHPWHDGRDGRPALVAGLLPKLLPNSVGRTKTGRDEELPAHSLLPALCDCLVQRGICWDEGSRTAKPFTPVQFWSWPPIISL
jgi:hypothetical protein